MKKSEKVIIAVAVFVSLIYHISLLCIYTCCTFTLSALAFIALCSQCNVEDSLRWQESYEDTSESTIDQSSEDTYDFESAAKEYEDSQR